ncbi:DUF4382 domain-containing protein [Desulfobacterales bacterium HSG16]|nr:DUF4382 domain-containing protein [Desulfobacterales bacterium HSG16]
MKRFKSFFWLAGIICMMSLIACDTSEQTKSLTTGDLSLSLTDATTTEYSAVYVTIDQVEALNAEGSSWEVVGTPAATYNLLELVNGLKAELGLTEMEAGQYSQMRLILGDAPDDGANIAGETHLYANYVLGEEGEIHELKVPGGDNTGIKLVHGFSIEPGMTTELVLDFNALKSVVKAGKSGQWMLKPTIKVVNTNNLATITGQIGVCPTYTTGFVASSGGGLYTSQSRYLIA